jgi:two-component system, sporulation sensor kinase C
MDYVYLPIINVMGTLTALLVYAYMYYIDRERYIALWAGGAFILLLRNILFDSGMLNWKQSAVGFFSYLMFYISCGLMFVWGIHLFIRRPLNKYWLVSAAGVLILSIISALLGFPIFYILLPTAWFGGVICIWFGIIYLCHFELVEVGLGRYVTGCAFLAWGILTMIFPFFIEKYKLLSFCGGILRFIIGPGTLIVYFEKNRTDLINKCRLLTQNAVDVIYRLRLVPEKRFDYISPAVYTVTGYAPEEYYADERLLSSLIHTEDLPLFEKSTNRYGSPSTFPAHFRLIRKNQQTIWVEQTCIPIYDNKSRIIAFEGIIRDVTARRALEQIAARVDRMNMVGQMAVSVAHEIRNPLTTVRGYLQLLGSKEECTIHKDRYDLMIEELDRTNTIIREYLLLSKDKMADLKNCCLNTIIRTLHPLMQAAAAVSNVDVKIDLQDTPELCLDENEIRQLLLNLVRNGIEAMPSGGEILIRTFLEQNEVGLSISDQGPGIPPHIYEHLGTPFLTTKENGTGLGLPICYRIAYRHNAAIDIKTSDQGTTFFVYFRLAA